MKPPTPLKPVKVTGAPTTGMADGDADDENTRITKKLLTRLSQRDARVKVR